MLVIAKNDYLQLLAYLCSCSEFVAFFCNPPLYRFASSACARITSSTRRGRQDCSRMQTWSTPAGRHLPG